MIGAMGGEKWLVPWGFMAIYSVYKLPKRKLNYLKMWAV